MTININFASFANTAIEFATATVVIVAFLFVCAILAFMLKYWKFTAVSGFWLVIGMALTPFMLIYAFWMKFRKKGNPTAFNWLGDRLKSAERFVDTP